MLCLVRWRTGSLYPCMALHSANNALALGVNQLSWSALAILGLVLASWLVIAVVVGPLRSRAARAADLRQRRRQGPHRRSGLLTGLLSRPMRRHFASCTAALAATIVSLGMFAGAAVADGPPPDP